MGQVTIYLDDEIEKKMKTAAKAAHLSQSKWVANLIQARVKNEWPDSIREMAGSWRDQPTAEESRKSLGRDIRREEL